MQNPDDQRLAADLNELATLLAEASTDLSSAADYATHGVDVRIPRKTYTEKITKVVRWAARTRVKLRTAGKVEHDKK